MTKGWNPGPTMGAWAQTTAEVFPAQFTGGNFEYCGKAYKEKDGFFQGFNVPSFTGELKDDPFHVGSAQNTEWWRHVIQDLSFTNFGYGGVKPEAVNNKTVITSIKKFTFDKAEKGKERVEEAMQGRVLAEIFEHNDKKDKWEVAANFMVVTGQKAEVNTS